MKFRNILIIFIISIFLLTGCEEEDVNKPKAGAYLGGTQGVMATFEAFGVEEEGLYTIFDTESFPIEVTIRNKGEHKLSAGDVTVELRGPSQNEVSGLNSWKLQNQDEIDEIADLIPDGGEETISFASDAEFTTSTSGFIDRHWFANIEYDYQTEILIPEVCLKEDLKDDRFCTVTESKDFFVSGAPVTVRTVDESTAGKGIMALKLKVANVGSGKVTKRGEKFGIRDTLAYSIDDADWECKSSGKVNEARMVNGEAEIVCKLKNPLAEDHISTKQIKVTLTYTYRDIIEETLRIKESVE